MNLPPGFHFSQANLQDFNDCRQRFYLRYIRQLSWPAVEAEPVLENEQFIRDGADFHRLVHQYFLGVPAERLSALIKKDNLREWWDNFVQYHAEMTGLQNASQCHVEHSLSIPLAGLRLLAKYDLIARLEDDSYVIYDWKTSHHRPGRRWLERRMQTVVYPYVLAHCSEDLAGAPTDPSQIKMIYWFANAPEQPEIFAYSQAQFHQAGDELIALAQRIAHLAQEGQSSFSLTQEEKHCEFCVYRSLCGRGSQAGSISELEEPSEEAQPIVFDLEQIAEIEF